MKLNFKKFLSRKFIVTLLTDILSVCVIISETGGKAGVIASILSVVLTSVVYVANETSIDKKNLTISMVTEEVIKDIEVLRPLIEDMKELENKNN